MFSGMKQIFQMMLFGVLGCVFSTALAVTQPTIIGKWVTIDDKTNKPSSVIAIKPEGSVVVGKIVKTFDGTSEKKIDRCVVCHDSRKNQPILGLKIIENMRCKPDYCRGGTILDPRDGKIYKANMRLMNHGRQLKVHGYIGMALFGKSVVWNRYK